MNTHLVTLERELARLARDFAKDLVRAVLCASVADLAALREQVTRLGPDAFADLRTPPGRKQEAATTARPPSVEPEERAATRSSRRSRTGKTAISGRARHDAERAHGDDGDGAANMITDPSSLLEVIAAGARTQLVRTVAALVSELLTPKAVDGAQGPALRPGERLQRTAGGNVVLRRGRA